MKAIGLCSAFNRMSNLKHSLTGFWLGLEKKMQLIRLFLNLPLCLMAVDLQIVTYWESQTLWSVLLSGGEGSFPLMGLRLHLSSVTVSGDSSLEMPGAITPLCAPWEVTRAAGEPSFYSLHWWLISEVFKDEGAFGKYLGYKMQALFFGPWIEVTHSGP